MSSSLRRRVLNASTLSRLLDTPDLAPRLQSLPASALREVLLEIGIEDASELIALTSFEQLRDVFDEDLRRSSAPGADAGFDAERFALWLEVRRGSSASRGPRRNPHFLLQQPERRAH